MDYYHEYFRIEHERLTVKAGNLRNELDKSKGEAAVRALQEDVAWVEAARNAMRGRL
jgi:hypothetical protein|tara:strand:+ start:172 stop:342 length:171 start_codon:yes stop_codon:yes gene_type:complete